MTARFYAHFADELPALEYRDNAFDAWTEIDSRREFEPQFAESSIYVKQIEPAKVSDFLPSSSQLLGLMRENMVEKIGNDDAIDNMKPGYGHPNEKFGELLSFAVEVFGQALDNHAKAVDFQIDGDIVVDEKHYRKGEHP